MTCLPAARSIATLPVNPQVSPSVILPTGPGGAVGGGAEFSPTFVGSATATPTGTSPIRDATTGCTSTPARPHSLLCAVVVTSPRRVPSACGSCQHSEQF